MKLTDFDSYGKVLDDFRIKTFTGGTITLISAAIILALVFTEFADYIVGDIQSEMSIDQQRSERMTINIDISMPRVPCFSESRRCAESIFALF